MCTWSDQTKKGLVATSQNHHWGKSLVTTAITIWENKSVNHKLVWILWFGISKCKACWQLKNCTCALLNNLMHSKLHTAAERSPMNSPKVFLQWPSWNLELQTQRPRLVHLPIISSFLVPSSSKLCNYRDECYTIWKALNMKGWSPMTQIENLRASTLKFHNTAAMFYSPSPFNISKPKCREWSCMRTIGETRTGEIM
jgi:hypothetical protein